MKYLSVCAGIEAATVAWHHMGWEPVAFSEIEKFPSAVLAHHYPNVPNWGDMTKFQEWPDACICGKLSCNYVGGSGSSNDNSGIQPNAKRGRPVFGINSKKGICNECNGTIVDVLVGGTPCQSFSVAGLRKGLDDPRGNLMLTYLAIAKRYRPEWLVWENVPGVLSSEGGRDFAALLRGLDELGYGWAYRVLDAQYFGVAQRRRRVFVVGYLGNWQRAAAVLFERHSLSGHPAPSRQARKGTASSTASGTRTGGWPAEISPTLTADFASKQGQENQHINGGAGMFVPVAFDAFNQADTGDLSKTVAARNDQDTASLVSGCWWDGGDLAPTLTKQNANGAQRMPDKDNFGAVLQPVAIQGTLIGRSENAGPQGSGADVSGAMFTLTKPDVHAVAFGGDIARSLTARYDSSPCADRGMDVVAVMQPVAFAQNQLGEVRTGEVLNTLNTNSNASGGNTPMVAQPMAFAFDPGQSAQPKATHQFCIEHTAPLIKERVHAVASTTMQVRRLTPVECERLQGFPDGYTNIPWRGKPESPDGPRYKALGNSMAVPCMVWIGERINEVSKL